VVTFAAGAPRLAHWLTARPFPTGSAPDAGDMAVARVIIGWRPASATPLYCRRPCLRRGNRWRAQPCRASTSRKTAIAAGAPHKRCGLRHRKNGAVQFISPRRKPARHARAPACSPRPVRPRPCRRSPRLSHRALRRRARRRGPQRRIPPAPATARAMRSIRSSGWRCAAARSIMVRRPPTANVGGELRDVHRARRSGTGAGERRAPPPNTPTPRSRASSPP